MVVRFDGRQVDQCRRQAAHVVDITEWDRPGTIVNQQISLMHSETNALLLRAGLGNACVVENVLRVSVCVAPFAQHPMHLAGVEAGGVAYAMARQVLDVGFESKAIGFHQVDATLVSKTARTVSLFSSLAACLGSSGSISYSAASACSNSFAEQRQRRGDAFQSIQWGPWLDVGMASSPGAPGKLSSQSFLFQKPNFGLRCLAVVEPVQRCIVGVFPINWSTYIRVFACTPLLAVGVSVVTTPIF